MRIPNRSSKKDHHGHRKKHGGDGSRLLSSPPPSPPPRSASPKLGNFGVLFRALADDPIFVFPDARSASPAASKQSASAAGSAPPSPAASSSELVASGPDDDGTSLARESEAEQPTPRVSFIPRDFLDRFDFSALSPAISEARSPVSSKARSSSPATQTYSTAASSPPSMVGDSFSSTDDRCDASYFSKPTDGVSLPGPNLPKQHAPVWNIHPGPIEAPEALTPSSPVVGTIYGYPVTVPSAAPVSYGPIYGPPCIITPYEGLSIIALAALKRKLRKAEQSLADDEHKLASAADRNYNRLARGAAYLDHYSYGYNIFPAPNQPLWFCPIPLGPLSRVEQVDTRDYQPQYAPLYAANVANPVYLASRPAKANIIAARLGLECAKDAVLQADYAAVSSDGIHVFVDMSNIIIGFYQHVKRRRGIHASKKMLAPPFWFEGLSLILQRGRHAAKRVVAGSMAEPHVKHEWPQYMKDADDLGYEMNILSRVSKPQPPTPKARRHNMRRAKPNSQSSTGSSDEDPRAAPPPCILRNGEQGVDEILHLKMCESVLDFERSTIVLATGDAAAAEFSGGFLAMAERALAKGWHVELVTWKSTISSSWRRLSTSRKWADRFRIVPLDSFVEELFDSLAPLC
ncbi:hypothetical protein RB595_007017 [Gaeumannomyces hyphopodioides]